MIEDYCLKKVVIGVVQLLLSVSNHTSCLYLWLYVYTIECFSICPTLFVRFFHTEWIQFNLFIWLQVKPNLFVDWQVKLVGQLPIHFCFAALIQQCQQQLKTKMLNNGGRWF